MTAPAYACPTSTTGPSIRSRVRSSAATSSSKVVNGTGTVTALTPFDWSPLMTLLQLDPSAQAPVTSTTFTSLSDISVSDRQRKIHVKANPTAASWPSIPVTSSKHLMRLFDDVVTCQ